MNIFIGFNACMYSDEWVLMNVLRFAERDGDYAYACHYRRS